jgi:ASPM-SPD-2-Hydin domain-containing protein/centrosomal CEP192-like protein/HYDIN/CFA65/VesB family protein/parallel beta helix pectate lyase-like protein
VRALSIARNGSDLPSGIAIKKDMVHQFGWRPIARIGFLALSVVASVALVSSCASTYAARRPRQLTVASSVNFGNVVVGTTGTQTLTATNTGSANTSITGVSVGGTGFSFKGPVLPVSLAPGQSATFTVFFVPSTIGSHQGSLVVSSDAKQGSTTVTLTGTGMPSTAQPSMAITPSSINFGNVPVGVTSTQTATVSNPGNASLDITQCTAPGNGFAVSGLSMPMTLTAGQAAKFSVSFTPSTAGNQTSNLALTSNAPSSPISVALSGSGVQQQPQISVLPTSLAFGNVTVGSSGKQSVTVSNGGNAPLSITAANVTGAGFATTGLSLPMTVAAGGSGTISVDFAPATSGSVTGSLSLSSNAPASPTTIALSGAGIAQTLQLSANPTSLNFGSEAVGSTSGKQSVTLTNGNSSQSMAISAISVSGPFAFAGATPPLTLNPSASLTLSVTFTPTSSGAASGTMAITSNAANSPTSVSLSGTGSSGSFTPSGPIVINGQSGTVIQGLKITSTTGDCVQITNSTNITIQNSEIGPCAGNGINIGAGNGIQVFDSYIHPETQSPDCCDNNDGIFSHDGTQNLTIQGNVIAYSESNIEVLDSSNVTVTGNFLLNPRNDASNPSRGQNFQCWQGGQGSGCSSITLQNNYALSSQNTTLYLYPEQQEDSINFGYTNGAVAQDNYVTGGHSSSGCGLIADNSANSIHFLSNLVLNTGQCGIGIADGTNQLVDSNKVYNTTPVAGGGNTAIYTWKEYTNPCGPTTVSNNIADEIKPDGTHSGFWDGGGCTTTLSGNVFDQSADASLTPVSTVFAPPLIPPKPKNCVVISPYSTQTSVAACVP